MISSNAHTDIYTDFNGLAKLRAQAKQAESTDVKRAVAEQFEAFFMQMMLKSMRDAVSKTDLFGGDKNDFYTSMYDQQLSLQLSTSNSLGIADMIYQQLLQGDELTELAAPDWQGPEGFVDAIFPTAQQVAKQIDIAPEAIMSVAALETGWGQHIMQDATGQSSFNLFGIKATDHWQGRQAVSPTLEFEHDVMVKRHAAFRAYDSAAESVSDFADFLQTNPRYANALDQKQNTQGFFKALQAAGYATDPEYANKLGAVLDSSTMRTALQKHTTSL